ncbi:MAG: hypothetical protein H0V70_03870 [Ktedonobacteraceae bacterium]|nr:hypothetical protein [Ktedonobacteraceae bacterium]
MAFLSISRFYACSHWEDQKEGDRTSARSAYETVGFRQIHTIRSRQKWSNQAM